MSVKVYHFSSTCGNLSFSVTDLVENGIEKDHINNAKAQTFWAVRPITNNDPKHLVSEKWNILHKLNLKFSINKIKEKKKKEEKTFINQLTPLRAASPFFAHSWPRDHPLWVSFSLRFVYDLYTRVLHTHCLFLLSNSVWNHLGNVGISWSVVFIGSYINVLQFCSFAAMARNLVRFLVLLYWISICQAAIIFQPISDSHRYAALEIFRPSNGAFGR